MSEGEQATGTADEGRRGPQDRGGDPWARLDLARRERTGDPEVIFGAGKAPDQVVTLLRRLHTAHPDRAVLATRLTDEAMDTVASSIGEARIDRVARCATLGEAPTPHGLVAVLSAGTSDQVVAGEAEITARCFGAGVVRINDVGVAGLHRLIEAKPEFDRADVLIVVAGMEGALPSVVGGLSGTPLIAVPTSIGYGASFGGLSALLSMLNSCAPGVVVTNIDGGFTAGVHAARIARRMPPTAGRPGGDA